MHLRKQKEVTFSVFLQADYSNPSLLFIHSFLLTEQASKEPKDVTMETLEEIHV